MIPDQYSAFRHKFTRMLEQFKSQWDGLLGSIRNVQHRIEIKNPGSPPINYAAYRASRMAREFNKHEIDRMLPMEVRKAEDEI